jgi:cytochrome oxidase Cu insertion factor (SCO1/SenC/PrrC family)
MKRCATQRAAGSYTVDHSAGMVLLGPDGRAVVRFAYATPARRHMNAP